MSAERATQIEMPSLRRVYTSRAFLMAISASGACRLPTCLCASPCCDRMNTSHNGHSLLIRPPSTFAYRTLAALLLARDPHVLACTLRSLAARRLASLRSARYPEVEKRVAPPSSHFARADSRGALRLSCRPLRRVRNRGLAHPGPRFPRVDARAHPIAIARSVALDDLVELVPVALADIIMAARLVPDELVVGDPQAEVIGLRRGLVDETLPQLVVGQQLDLPARRLRTVHVRRVGRPEHHPRRPPPAVQR